MWVVKPLQVSYKQEHNEDHIGNYTSVIYTMQIERRSGFYIANVIVPSILINYLSLASFLINSHSDEKIGFSVTIFLAQALCSFTLFARNYQSRTQVAQVIKKLSSFRMIVDFHGFVSVM